MEVTIVLVLLGVIVGYALGKAASPSLDKIEQGLESISSSLQKLTKALCGDRLLERAIKETNEVGATLSDEELAYEGGSLDRMSRTLQDLARRVASLTVDAKNKRLE